VADSTHLASAFRKGLKEAAVEGENVAIQYRYADNQIDRLPALVADLGHRPVAVILVNAAAAHAAKAATTKVSIVFVTGRPGPGRSRRQPESSSPQGGTAAAALPTNQPTFRSPPTAEIPPSGDASAPGAASAHRY
jgi:putative ABC transport system substrate-binding protein